MRKLIGFDEGWEVLQEGLTKLENILAGKSEHQFSSEEYMRIYSTVFCLCSHKDEHDYRLPLYHKYKENFEEYLSSVVLPSLQDKGGDHDHDHESLLREFFKRWSNHKVMVRWRCRLFDYLDRSRWSTLPDLTAVGFNCFRDHVYAKVKEKVRDAVCFLIDQERKGERIDGALLRDVVDIFVEIGDEKLNCYKNDLEAALLDHTARHYSRKASLWNLEKSSQDYAMKVDECLKFETDRISQYLHPSTEPKLLERVRKALSATPAT